MMCACGCGEETNLAKWSCARTGAVKGQPLLYRRGHRTRMSDAVRKAKRVAKQKLYAQTTRGKQVSRYHSNKWRLKDLAWNSLQVSLCRFRLTLDQYHAKLEAQDFCCAICGEYQQRLHIDHHHDSSRVRGLLCRLCNTGIGYFREQPAVMRQAAVYAEKWA